MAARKIRKGSAKDGDVEAYPINVRRSSEFAKFNNEYLVKESDRAAGILAAEFLSSLLEELLELSLVPGKSRDRLMFEDKRPLQSFSARIDCAHAIGLIASAAMHDLHIIRAIRNDCAHDLDIHGFGHPTMINRCQGLKLKQAFKYEFKVVDRETARDVFLFATFILSAHIGQQMYEVKEAGERQPARLSVSLPNKAGGLDQDLNFT